MASRIRNNRLVKRVSGMSTRRKFAAGAVAVVIAAGAVAATVGSSGAYLSETKKGTFTGTTATEHGTTLGGSGADGLDFSFDNLAPGDDQTKVITVTSTGTLPADVYMTFDPQALNDGQGNGIDTLGTYGHVKVTFDGKTVFESSNLNNRASTCGAFSETGCWPLPDKLLVAKGLKPGDSGKLRFTFGYAGKLSAQGADPSPFNAYKGADGSDKSGLPYQVVFMQPGQQP